MSIVHLLALHDLSEIGSVRLKALLDYFGDAEAAWNNFAEWPQALQHPRPNYELLREEMRHKDLAALEERFLCSGARVVTMAEPHYPQLLASIVDAPYLLFYRGTLPTDDDLCIAIIGSRKATAYGREAAAFLARGLAKAGVTVVGGLARGIDTCGHRGALDAGGRTIGVLGCGIDVVYPRENKQLFEEVAANGCILSEYPLGMQPLAKNFPIRNRIVSGLSQGVIVVEAELRSGTQITVDHALEQGRNIYAVPGSIFSPASAGVHRMIRDYGFKPVTSAGDVLEDYPQGVAYGRVEGLAPQSVQQSLFPPEPLTVPVLTPDERRLWDLLVTQRHFNELAEDMAMDASSLAALLTISELRGFIKRLDGQYYVRNNL